jgi:hypothetical protein
VVVKKIQKFKQSEVRATNEMGVYITARRRSINASNFATYYSYSVRSERWVNVIESLNRKLVDLDYIFECSGRMNELFLLLLLAFQNFTG